MSTKLLGRSLLGLLIVSAVAGRVEIYREDQREKAKTDEYEKCIETLHRWKSHQSATRRCFLNQSEQCETRNDRDEAMLYSFG